MTTVCSNVFSSDDLTSMNTHTNSLSALHELNGSTKSIVSFVIPLTDSMRTSLQAAMQLDLSNVSNLPMRWIKGDMTPHIDSGPAAFQNTYLVYLNGSTGEFIVDSQSYPITANTGFIFNEGVSHQTVNTGTTPRLLLGPMGEQGNQVGAAAVSYYSNETDALAQNNLIAAQGGSWIVGDTPNIYFGSIGSYNTWRIALINGGPAAPTGVYSNGFDLLTLGLGGYSFHLYPSAPCFLEGSQILCQVNGVDTYQAIETLEKGMYVKTSDHGYQKIEMIRKGIIKNPGNDRRIQNRLYKCSPKNYPGLTKDLYLTGCHSILVQQLKQEERLETIKQLGKIYSTDGKYRLMACIDARSEPWNSEGEYTIWHLALEHPDIRMNYGIYANGLLVETCSINFLKNHSNMATI
jgi:hypothetical protein